jgi:hypothetical protein
MSVPHEVGVSDFAGYERTEQSTQGTNTDSRTAGTAMPDST